MPTAPLDPSVHKTTEALLLDKMGDGHGLVLSEAEQARVDYLARYAENALKRWWRNERRYHSRCVALVEQDEDGEWVECEVADEQALEALRRVGACVDRELLLERLRRLVDEVEWAIIQGVLEGKRQKTIAQELGFSPPSLHRRLKKIQEKARAILGEIGGETREKGRESS